MDNRIIVLSNIPITQQALRLQEVLVTQNSRFDLSTLVLSLALAVTPATAETDVVLTVRNGEGAVLRSFTDADLSALPQGAFETETIWTAQAHRFAGPTLVTVLEAAGIGELTDDHVILLHALNDYTARIEVSLIDDAAPIVANRIDDAPFPLRENGPLWVLFPYDQSPTYQTEVTFAVSVWQLFEITVE